MTIGEKILKLRTEKNLTQKQLADICGFSQSALNFWENGKRQPKKEQLEKIAEYFNVTPAYIMGWENSGSENYYLNEETAKTAQEIFENKELRMLFDAARDADPEDLKALHNMALALKRKERGNVDDTGC